MIIAGVGVVLFGFASLLYPEEIWRKTEGWKYDNPEANKPSETGYLSNAGGLLFVGVVVIVVALTLL